MRHPSPSRVIWIPSPTRVGLSPWAHFLVRDAPVRGHAGHPRTGGSAGVDVDVDIRAGRRVLNHVAGLDRLRFQSRIRREAARAELVCRLASQRLLG